MHIDENEFFREATIRICGSLDVETFLYESFLYLRDYLPADSVFLTHYRPERGEHAALARASAEGSSLLNLTVTIPPDIRTFVVRPDKETPVVDRAEMHPTARPWISKGLLEKDASLLVLRLIVDGDIVGGVTFISKQSGAFTMEHADLVSLLREPFTIALSNSVRYQELLELKELLAEDNRFLHSELRQIAGEEIIGADFGLSRVMEMVLQVAPLSSPVLLLGETGTGKEVIANAIHNLSPRKDAPFITVNCGAIPENLIDSELFGHEKGAFTGALSRKRGRFERANGGTIFLDEVGELQPDAQVRLLRVLQEKEIERVGGTEQIKVDIRVIAATHRDLEAMITEGKFRDDLYFRLNVFPIAIPPLRDRRGDIPSLVHYFIQKKSREMDLRGTPTLTPRALERLTGYFWPGNIRELENLVERSLILSRGEPLSFNDFQTPLKPKRSYEQGKETILHRDNQGRDSLALDAILSLHIRRVLDMTSGRVGGKQGAAYLLNINPSTLRKKMRKLGIPFGRKAKFP
ncbi:MAG: sigma-54-dependent Fis family transcriptional regulator [Deltaproteobacteria bacterium]|nr:sigma-54-dependent Fis family transcriptional regulator [Deltaproteobacteria bacterium]